MNTQSHYGLVSVLLHWSIALLTIALFFLGLWMVDLDYYNKWYQLMPWWHKGIGIIVLMLLVSRWCWQLINPSPEKLGSILRWQQIVVKFVHLTMNSLVLFICVSGYFMVTAKGQILTVFDWFTIPATVTGVDNMEDVSGLIHQYLAYLLMGMVGLHVFAALMHHFVYKDATLKRILGL